MAKLLNGKEAAARLNENLAVSAQILRDAGVVPTLAILRVGEQESDLSYERGAAKRCQLLGVEVRRVTLPGQCSQDQLMAAIKDVNEDSSIHGCLILRPLPKHLNERAACEALRPEKDVDGVTSGALATVFSGRGAGYPPCTAAACVEILDHYHCDLEGQRVTVVGRSLVVGKPLAMMLLERNATVTLCHSHTEDLPARCREADILVVAAGKAGIVDRGSVARGQVILDVGIHMGQDGRLRGDVDFPSVEPVAGAITPVPGGVGAVTTSVLARHVIQAASRASGVHI